MTRFPRVPVLFLFAVSLVFLTTHHASLAGPGDCSGLPSITGTAIPTKYAGSLSAVQDNPTGFGDVSPPNPQPSEGSELNELFLRNDNTNLYIGITGNTPRTDNQENTVLIFIDTGENGGTAVLNTFSSSTCCVSQVTPGCDDSPCQTCVCGIDPLCCDPQAAWDQTCVDLAFTDCSASCTCLGTDASAALRNLRGVTLDFAPEYVVAIWNVEGVQNGRLIDLRDPAPQTGTVLTEGVHFAVNNDNLAGVNDEPANDPGLQTSNAQSAVTGVEVKIELLQLNLTSTSAIRVQALVASGSGFLSNQSLPPLRPTDGTSGGGVNCVGNHDPAADPPSIVDFSDINAFPGNQHIEFTLSSPGAAPAGTLDGVLKQTDINGNITSNDYGPPLAIQNNFTCFGDARPFEPVASNGSEINQLWVRNNGEKLFIGVTGNIPSAEADRNTIIVFIDIGDFGANTLNTLSHTDNDQLPLFNMNGVTFDDGFAPAWAVMYWRGNNQHNGLLQATEFSGTKYPLSFRIDSSDHLDAGLNAFSADLSNLIGVTGIVGDDPIRQEEFAADAQTGVVFSLRLADLFVSPFSTIRVSACIVSASGFISNQFLPPLNPTNPVPEQQTVTHSGAPLPLAIPDNSGTPGSDSRLVDLVGNIDRVTDLNVGVNITHPDISQLEITLRHEETERQVVLLEAGAAVGSNLNIVFDSEGAPAVQPTESLLTFNDVNPNATWTLFVEDTVTGVTGTLNSWSLHITEYTGGTIACIGNHAPTAEPPNIVDMANYPGNQFVQLTLNPASGAPSAFNAQNIPSAFLPAVPLATQNNYSCFGDSVAVPPANPPGSELDRIFVKNSNDRLKVAVTGNLENNQNACILLLDTNAASGNQTIAGITPPPGPLGGTGGVGGEPGLNGLSLDTGFRPDYGLVFQRSDSSAPADVFTVFLTNLNTNFTRTIGRTVRNSDSGVLLPPVANGNGSELNQMFVRNDGDHVYVGLTGNLEGNGNVVLIFLDTVEGQGSNVLATNVVGFPAELVNVNGDVLDTDLQADYAIVLRRPGGVASAQLVDLVNTSPVSVMNLTLQSSVGANVFAVDNSNGVGVNSNFLDDTTDSNTNGIPNQVENAATAVAGFVFSLARADIGAPSNGASIRLCAAVGSNSGFWSNQFLPGLGGGVGNLGFTCNLPGNVNSQTAAYAVAANAGYFTPATFDGSNIPGQIGGLLTTQNNYTQFGNVTLPPNAGNANCMQVAFNDSNLTGVTNALCTPGSGTIGDPLLAETGIEFDIPLVDLGLPNVDSGGDGLPVKVMAVITGPFGYLSNQFLPPLGTGDKPNLTSAAGINLGDNVAFPGNQFLSYVLSPQTCGDIAADIDGDGDVDDDDINAFVGVLLGSNIAVCPLDKSDFNGDDLRNGLDVQLFVNELLP